MNRLSVLLLTHWYPDKNNKSFGIFIKRHAHAVNTQNHVVALAFYVVHAPCIYKKKTDVFYDEAGMETHKIRIESRFNLLLFVLLPLHYFILKNYLKKKLLVKHQFHLIHSNVIYPSAIIGHWLSKKVGCPHIITEHWTKVDRFFFRSVYKYEGKKAYNKARAITCVSEQLADTLKKYTNNKNISIIPNVIDNAEFSYTSGVEKYPVLTFVAVSHWGGVKNPFYFLNALQQLHTQNRLPEFKVVLIGNGKQIDKIKTNGYSFTIIYKGNLEPEEIKTEFNKSHIFLHGSEFETFSVVIAEALMCGLPCVVSPVGIAHGVINQTNGFVTNNTAADWVLKIEKCVNTTYNNEAIAGAVKNKYSSHTVLQMFNSVYDKALASN